MWKSPDRPIWCVNKKKNAIRLETQIWYTKGTDNLMTERDHKEVQRLVKKSMIILNLNVEVA